MRCDAMQCDAMLFYFRAGIHTHTHTHTHTHIDTSTANRYLLCILLLFFFFPARFPQGGSATQGRSPRPPRTSPAQLPPPPADKTHAWCRVRKERGRWSVGRIRTLRGGRGGAPAARGGMGSPQPTLARRECHPPKSPPRTRICRAPGRLRCGRLVATVRGPQPSGPSRTAWLARGCACARYSGYPYPRGKLLGARAGGRSETVEAGPSRLPRRALRRWPVSVRPVGTHTYIDGWTDGWMDKVRREAHQSGAGHHPTRMRGYLYIYLVGHDVG